MYRLLRSLVLMCVLCLIVPAIGRAAPSDGFGGLGSFMSPGPLAKAHAKLDGITTCTECHVPGEGVPASSCMRCHDSVQGQVIAKKGFHSDKGGECVSCHPDHLGRGFGLIRMSESNFDHAPTGFDLTGAHEQTECAQCHTERDTWTGLQTSCRGCHNDAHGTTPGARILLDRCEACHGTGDWKALPIPTEVFDHGAPKQADFALSGAHAKAECETCHVDWHFTPVEHDGCTSCHDSPHRMSVDPTCTTCHETPDVWTVRGFAHSLTPFELVGQHTSATCSSCHGSNKTRRMRFEQCADCHKDPHDQQFSPRGCDACHSVHVADFELVDFDHAKTDFVLTGQHSEVACASCHGERGTYAGLDHKGCDSCHDDAHDGRFWPTPCSTCHSDEGWAVDGFDHDRTDFPLAGKHAQVECASCHGEHDWSGVAHGACTDCHANDNPHGDKIAGETCEDCHGVDAWSAVRFDHGARTSFDLSAAHSTQACASCHTKGEPHEFTGLKARCGSCHETTRPAGHYKGECASCHTGSKWRPGGLGDRDHSVTGFALSGAHKTAACSSCHANDDAFTVVESTCVGCHAADDAHQHQLGDMCADCHTAGSWVRTRWRHHRTGWPLRGSHRLAACVDCHAAGYVGTPTECWRCHETDAPAGVESHNSVYFSSCDTCHVPYTWQMTRFAH